MRLKAIMVGLVLVALPTVAMAQQAQSKEPLLIQLYEDALRSRQNTEIELGTCKVQVKDLQQQLQTATEKKETKEKK